MTPKFLPGYPVLWTAETIQGPNAALQNEQGSQTRSADCPRLLCPPRGDSGQQLQLCMGAQHRIELGEGNGPDKVCSQMLANQSWPGDHNQSHRGTDLHIANKSRARKAKTSIKYMHIPLIHLVLHAFFNECNWSSFGPFAKLLVPLVPRYHFPFVSLSPLLLICFVLFSEGKWTTLKPNVCWNSQPFISISKVGKMKCCRQSRWAGLGLVPAQVLRSILIGIWLQLAEAEEEPPVSLLWDDVLWHQHLCTRIESRSSRCKKNIVYWKCAMQEAASDLLCQHHDCLMRCLFHILEWMKVNEKH